MTPFRDNQLRNRANDHHSEAEKKQYNKKLSSIRAVIEHAFGMLKGRFRRLTYLETKTVKKAVDIVCAACVLHNMCMTDDEELADMHQHEVNQNMDDHDAGNNPADAVQGAAVVRRTALVDEVLALLARERE